VAKKLLNHDKAKDNELLADSIHAVQASRTMQLLAIP
jgi:hypothetical protein